MAKLQTWTVNGPPGAPLPPTSSAAGMTSPTKLGCGRSVTREALTSRLSVLPVDGSLEVYVLNGDGD